jgi:hypothetical protein
MQIFLAKEDSSVQNLYNDLCRVVGLNRSCPEMILTGLQKRVLALIEEFLSPSTKRVSLPDFQSLSNESVAKEFNSLELMLPRQTGSTLIAHLLCHDHECLVVTHNLNSSEQFIEDHKKMFPNDEPTVVPVHVIKKEQNLLATDFDRLKMIADALVRSDVIVFDVYRAFAQNSAVTKLMKELGRTHRFIFFR